MHCRFEDLGEVLALERCVLLDVRHIPFGVSRIIILSVMLMVFIDRLFSLNFPLQSNPECIVIVIGEVITLVQVYAVDRVLDVSKVFYLALVVQNSLI